LKSLSSLSKEVENFHQNFDHLEQANLQQEHDMLDERRRQVEQIESDIIDVNQIMTKLSGLVHDQGQQMGE